MASFVARARGLVRFTRRAAIAEGAGALVLWMIVARPLQAETGSLLAGIAFLCLLLLPGAVLWLFYTGLSGIASLPDALEKSARNGTRQGRDLLAVAREAAARPGWRSGWNVIRSILELRSLAVRTKSLLLGLGIVLKLRFLNPLFLVVVLASFAASVAVVGLACLALLLAAF